MRDMVFFISGVAIGSLVTWKLIEQKYKDIADEEIKSVVDEFKKDKKDDNEDTKIDISSTINSVKMQQENTQESYEKIVNNLHYDKVNEKDNKVIEKDFRKPLNSSKEIKANYPYIIPMEEFGILDDWDTKDWMYWNDDVLTDENDQPVIDYEPIIGDEALLNFDYELGSVHVRNEKLHCDYEILRSEKNFNE